jgi:hypothetical protein
VVKSQRLNCRISICRRWCPRSPRSRLVSTSIRILRMITSLRIGRFCCTNILGRLGIGYSSSVIPRRRFSISLILMEARPTNSDPISRIHSSCPSLIIYCRQSFDDMSSRMGIGFGSIVTTFKELFEMAIFEIRSVANLLCYEYSTKTYPMRSSIRCA